MEVMPRRTFEASVEGKLQLWDRTLYELELELGSSSPERRSRILSEMEKLGSKRRAAMLKLREMRLRDRRLPDDRRPLDDRLPETLSLAEGSPSRARS
ncbi:MAG: hypothetical protein JW820_12415 [Spirochaetales bacterium]|nr:hypothetical protein [Spirochaetales bacterium]